MQMIEPKKTLVEQTYDILLDAICSGELAPGDRLNQDDIATRLRVSRQPVNSAISILKANNFVQDTGRRGVVVSALDVDHFRSIYEYRSVIEPFALRLASTRIGDTAKQQAEKILRMGHSALQSGDARTLLQSDVAFHEMIYGWSGNKVIETSMRLNWHHMRRSMAEVLRNPELAVSSWEDHQIIVAAFFEGDIKAAEEAMQSHITRAQAKTLGSLVD